MANTRGTLYPPLFSLKAGNKSLPVKSKFPASGGKTPLLPKTEFRLRDFSIYTSLVASLGYYPKPQFCADSSLIRRFAFALPVPHRFIVSFSKRYTSCPLPTP